MGDNCEHGNDVRYGCKHCDDAGTEPPLARGRMTDLPDAVVNAAVEAFARKRNPKHNTLDHSETLAIRAALAAASGPWAEQLDAAKAEREALKQEVADRVGDLVNLQRQLDAALARNAELEAAAEYAALYERTHAERDAARAELDNLRGKLTALADETPWKTTDHLGNVTGYLINADELRAIVRGSDDE